MGSQKVYVTRNIGETAITFLKQYFDVICNEQDRAVSRDELLKGVRDADAVLCPATDTIDAGIMDAAKKVKIFANFAVGFDNIDVEEATKRGIIITNTPDVLSDATAEMAWGLLFAVARRVVEADQYTREGKFEKWSPKLFLGQELTGKTLGVIGAGRIGKAFAKKSIGFDMKILYHNRRRDEDFEERLNAQWVEKETLLKEADFISLHVPLTEDTYHLIGDKELQIMKKSAILINTARGPIVDEVALVKALKNQEIWGAGLDVFEKEPKLEEELKELDNVVLTPHIGSAAAETRDRMAMLAAENIVAVLKGQEPITPVNRI